MPTSAEGDLLVDTSVAVAPRRAAVAISGVKWSSELVRARARISSGKGAPAE